MVTPAARREAVAHLREQHAVSERRACRVLGADRTAVRYRSIRPDDAATRARPRALAGERRRFGYRRLGLLLSREGLVMNHKKLRRLYVEERLQVRRRGGRKRPLGTRAPIALPDGPNQRWSLDFMSDSLADGRRFRMLCVVDDCTRECLSLVADTSLSGLRAVLAAWREDYNHVRPHSALGGRAPGWLSVPPCSPASRPLRVACGDGLRPALTQAARDGSGEDGRDGETALDRTEKHRHDGRGGNRGLYF